METYYNIRTVKASSEKQALKQVIDGNFLEHDELSDVVVNKNNLIKKLSEQETKKFPNGFASWQETHFEIVKAIALNGEDYHNKVNDIEAIRGTGGLYEFAEELTNKFELLNKGRVWDGEFFEEIEEFISNEFKND